MNVYIGLFLIAFTTLAMEVTLARLVSIITWYHLAFFAISTAMLGMTAGAVTVYLKTFPTDEKKLNIAVAKASLGYALSVPISLLILCNLPFHTIDSVKALAPILTIAVACSLPYYFSGIAIALVLTKSSRPIGKLYGSDLIGAALGCIFVLVGMEFVDAPSLILFCAALGAVAAWSFSWRSSRALPIASCIFTLLLVLLGFLNASTEYKIRPPILKGDVRYARNRLWEYWNSFSYVMISKGQPQPSYWGPSPKAPKTPIVQYRMNIDGGAGTSLRRFSSMKDIEHLRYDVTNVAYFLRNQGGACIIGVGGARDIQSAILFGHNRITGLDVNPIFINLLQKQFRNFAGVADYKGVNLVVAEARSYLASTTENYSIIQMSLIDTWAATSAGAYSLSENGLYTVEAWDIFLRRLNPDGIFTVSRWYNPQNLGETGRMISLAVASLLRSGIKDPSRYIAMVSSGRIATLLVSKQPLTPEDVSNLEKVSSGLRYRLHIAPGILPQNEVLQQIISMKSLKELDLRNIDPYFNYEPPTDDNPYFFIMLRLDKLGQIPADDRGRPIMGVIRGNLLATHTLLWLIASLIVLTAFAIVLPLVFRTRKRQLEKSPFFWSGAFYFSLIGAGFMFAEIGMIQRLSVFLGHPMYALGVLLFTVIASTGVGSFLSERLPLTRKPWLWIYPLVTAIAILAMRFILSYMGSSMMSSGQWSKIFASISVVAPLGILMGFFFPTGMRLVKSAASEETPWYWALNGSFGILSSALAVFISIYLGIATNFYISTACYMLTILFILRIYSAVARTEDQILQIAN